MTGDIIIYNDEIASELNGLEILVLTPYKKRRTKMSKKNDFHVYVDGSAMTDTNRYGIGWVKTNHKDKQPSEKSKRLPFAKACSTAAEVYAAADALEHIR